MLEKSTSTLLQDAELDFDHPRALQMESRPVGSCVEEFPEQSL